MLVAAAVDLRCDLHVWALAPDEQRANPFGTIKLVGCDRHEIDAIAVHVYWNFPDCLDGIAVKQYASLIAQPANLRNRLDRAHFIVGVHHADKNCLVAESSLYIFNAEQAIVSYRQISDAIPVLLQMFAGIEHGFVLGCDGNNVVALLSACLDDSLDCEVIALRRSRSEDDLLRSRSNGLRDLHASGFDSLLGLPTEFMAAAGGIAKLLAEVRKHCLHNARIYLCRGVVVEINRKLHELYRSLQP